MFCRFLSLFCFIGVLLAGGCSKRVEEQFGDRILPTSDRSDPGLKLYWSGAASVVLDDGSHSILIDPFVSRKDNRALAIAFGREAEVNAKLIADRSKEQPEIARAQAVFVGHSHYDHSLDVAGFASGLNVPVYGSPDTGRVVKAHGYSNFHEINPHRLPQSFRIHGGFKVTALPGRHGQPPVRLGPFFYDPLAERVADNFTKTAAVKDYGLGDVFTFLIEHKDGNVLHIGTAGLQPGFFDDFRERTGFSGEVDVVLLSLVGRSDGYIEEIMRSVRPRFVIPIHYDNLFKPLAKGARATRLADLDGYFRHMQAEHGDVKTGIILFDTPWQVPKR